MTPEAERYLAKARQTLQHGRIMLTVNLAEDAGRTAYLAAYQAAAALIFERTGRVAKTHKGVHTEFARLAVHEPGIAVAMRKFLPQAYDLKAQCDYELGPDAVVPVGRAEAAIETATQFVECIAAAIRE